MNAVAIAEGLKTYGGWFLSALLILACVKLYQNGRKDKDAEIERMQEQNQQYMRQLEDLKMSQEKLAVATRVQSEAMEKLLTHRLKGE